MTQQPGQPFPQNSGYQPPNQQFGQQQQVAPPAYPPPGSPVMQQGDKGGGAAVASLVLGLVGLLAWCIACVGFIVSIIGIITGVIGLKSTRRKSMATWGLILSILCLVASIINGILGAMMAVSGDSPFH